MIRGAWFSLRLPFLKTGLLGTANDGLRGSADSNIMRFGTANARRSDGRFFLLSAKGVRDTPGDRGSTKLLLEAAVFAGELCRQTMAVLLLLTWPWASSPAAEGLACSFLEAFFDVECVEPILR